MIREDGILRHRRMALADQDAVAIGVLRTAALHPRDAAVIEGDQNLDHREA
jgi:hypothetical protein